MPLSVHLTRPDAKLVAQSTELPLDLREACRGRTPRTIPLTSSRVYPHQTLCAGATPAHSHQTPPPSATCAARAGYFSTISPSATSLSTLALSALDESFTCFVVGGHVDVVVRVETSLEALDRLPHRLAKLGQTARAKDEDQDTEDQKQLSGTEIEDARCDHQHECLQTGRGRPSTEKFRHFPCGPQENPSSWRLSMALLVPRPLAEADLSGVEGLVCDLDDTLTREGVLEAESVSALHEARRAGLRLVLVTGRPLGWTDILARLLPVDVAVGENGAGWAYRRGHRIQRGYFDDDATRATHQTRLSEVRARMAQAFPNVPLASDQTERRCDLAFDIGEEAPATDEVVQGVVRTIREAGAQPSVSSVHAHAIPGAWDKASGMRRGYEEAMGRDPDPKRFVFVGDSGNDQAAFAWFPLSVGVANVTPRLGDMIHPPRFVTPSDRGQGFSEVVTAVLNVRATG